MARQLPRVGVTRRNDRMRRRVGPERAGHFGLRAQSIRPPRATVVPRWSPTPRSCAAGSRQGTLQAGDTQRAEQQQGGGDRGAVGGALRRRLRAGPAAAFPLAGRELHRLPHVLHGEYNLRVLGELIARSGACRPPPPWWASSGSRGATCEAGRGGPARGGEKDAAAPGTALFSRLFTSARERLSHLVGRPSRAGTRQAVPGPATSGGRSGLRYHGKAITPACRPCAGGDGGPASCHPLEGCVCPVLIAEAQELALQARQDETRPVFQPGRKELIQLLHALGGRGLRGRGECEQAG